MPLSRTGQPPAFAFAPSPPAKSVLTRGEVRAVLSRLDGPAWLIAGLIYGSGLRLGEALRLRVRDLDLLRRELSIRDQLGHLTRTTVVPETLVGPLGGQLTRLRAQHRRDLAGRNPVVKVPPSVRQRFPHASRGWMWQWLFPAPRLAGGPPRRVPLPALHVQRALSRASRNARLPCEVTTDLLRDSFATHLAEQGYDPPMLLKLLGETDLTKTLVYAQLAAKGPHAVRSPLDR